MQNITISMQKNDFHGLFSVYKPDNFGTVMMWQYTQTLNDDGEVDTTFQEHQEHIAELVTHKNVLEQYKPSYVDTEVDSEAEWQELSPPHTRGIA